MTLKNFTRIYFVLLGLCIGGISSAQSEAYIYDTPASRAWTDSVMQKLTDDEKIAQLFMIYAETTWKDANLRFYEKQLKEYCPGGLILFQGGPKQSKQFIDNSQKVAKVPLLIGVDGEYGLSMRMDSFPQLPYNMVMGAVRDNRIIVEAGNLVGLQCRGIGAQLNFAPVLDVNNNPENPVINYRSYGEDPDNVVNKAYSFNYGMAQVGVTGVGKHFPGHGNTNVDSHHALPVIEGDYTSLAKTELYPFQQLSKRGFNAMMIGHLQVPGLDATLMPATLSPAIVQGVFKDSLHFDGLVISDGMNMAAVTKGYEKPFVKAILAGNDILLLPAVYSRAFAEVKDAVATGDLTMDIITERCERVLQAKYQMIHAEALPDSLISSETVYELTDKIYRNAITLLKNEGQCIPFQSVSNQKVALLENGAPGIFTDKVEYYEKNTRFQLPDNTDELSKLKEELAQYAKVIVGIHGGITSSKTNYGVKLEWLQLIDSLSQETEVHLTLMANPYALLPLSKAAYDRIKSITIAYSDHESAQSYAAQVLYGGVAAMGKLSVSIPPLAKVGEGYFTVPSRMGFRDMKQTRIYQHLNDSITEVVNEALDGKMTPGCQILVAQKGQIIYHESFGYHTYLHKHAVTNTDLYDIASLTKITATLPILMKLDEEGKFNTSQTLGDYLPRLDSTNKANLVLRDVLRHTAGLKSYIAFHLSLVDPKSVEKYGLLSWRYSSIFNRKIDDKAYLSKYMKFYKGMLNTNYSEQYPTQVAEKLYVNKQFADSIIAQLDSSEVSDGGAYRYSDLGYYYLQDIIEQQTGSSIDQVVQHGFFEPLGMYATGYRPLTFANKEEIIPTEQDNYFRKQLLHGYVHDQGAALKGGVAAHAGLFSNAGDLSKLFQMMLNGGTYGGNEYLDWITINHYTTDTEGEGRRALGYDKPELDPEKVGPTCSLVSPASYGHTGFTGTYVWVDPTYELIYIFLSNRIHPNVWNKDLVKEDIRTRIQEKIYNCLITPCL